MDSSRRLRPKASMPHVSSQWQWGEGQDGSYHARLSTGPARKSTEYLRPLAIPPCQPGRHMRQSPSMNSLTPKNDRWDFGSIRHIRQYSSDNKTPISAVDSVFELPSATSYNSPNSSTHSSFIAELEDTSPRALRSQELKTPTSPIKSPAISHSSMEFKSAQITSRAVIKVVDETIAAIEDANRKLLSRAVAAEEAAKLLREQNSELELQIKQYNRPKTAPSQPPNKNRFHHRPSYSQTRTCEMRDYHDPTPLSTFNATIDKLLLPTPPKRNIQPRDPPPYPLHQSKSQKNMRAESAPKNPNISPTSPTTKLSAPPKHHQRPPPSSHPLNSHSRHASHPSHHSTSDPNPNLNSNPTISSPLPGTVSRHEVTLAGTRLSATQRAKNISLEEARRRAKPLPPLGPMSPSVLRGVVEIGTPKGVDEFGRELRFIDVPIGKGGKEGKRGFSGFFRWRRDKGLNEKEDGR